MRIIFSRDRAAQLDLLLQSLDRNAEPEPTGVIWTASTVAFWKGYATLLNERRELLSWPEHDDDFNARFWEALARAGEHVTFLCDDDVLFAPLRRPELGLDHDVLCFSPRLGKNTASCYPLGAKIAPPVIMDAMRLFGNEDLLRYLWDWRGAEGDWGYPGSLDGHTFRTADVHAALGGRRFGNPTELEDALQAGLLELTAQRSGQPAGNDWRPLMACYPRSVLCSIPVNQVSEQSQVRAGREWPISPEWLNDRYLAGERIDLDALDFSGVDAAHYEIPFAWSTP